MGGAGGVFLTVIVVVVLLVVNAKPTSEGSAARPSPSSPAFPFTSEKRTASFRFRNVPEATLAPGQADEFTLEIERDGYDGPITLSVGDAAEGIRVTPGSGLTRDSKLQILLTVGPGVSPGWYQPRIIGTGTGDLRAQVVIPIHVSKPKVAARRIKNSLNMELILIPTGTFERGSPNEEKDRDGDEGPVKQVRITRPFYMGVHEVTQGEFEQVMGYNPSYFRPGGTGELAVKDLDNKRLPVESVSWDDALEFCRKLNAREEEKKSGRRYRLPTEAEWEYACRGNSKTYQVFHKGNSFGAGDGNVGGEQPYGNARIVASLERTTTVGSYSANAFGLCDMHGNVYEWCNDNYHDSYYDNGPADDPLGPEKGEERVLRGGAWNKFPRECRSATRFHLLPNTRNPVAGFRLVCETSETSP